MSYQAVESVLRYSKAEGTDRLVLMVLATHADAEQYECHPSRTLLCQETKMSERNLVRCFRQLQALGELAVEYGSGRGNLSAYTIRLPRINGRKGDNSDTLYQTQAAEKRVTDLSERVTDSAKRVTEPTPFPLPVDTERVTDSTPFPNPTDTERVTDLVKKGDRSVRAYKEEPSGTIKLASSRACATPASEDEPMLDASGLPEENISAADEQRAYNGKQSGLHFPDFVAYVRAMNPTYTDESVFRVARSMRDKGEADEVRDWLAVKSGAPPPARVRLAVPEGLSPQQRKDWLLAQCKQQAKAKA